MYHLSLLYLLGGAGVIVLAWWIIDTGKLELWTNYIETDTIAKHIILKRADSGSAFFIIFKSVLCSKSSAQGFF